MTEELKPIAKECCASALEDNPELSGRLALEFAISGDPSVGGVVDDVGIDRTSSTIGNPALVECMRESTFTLLFDPPKIADA